ncbi:histidine kinase/DNA gyrase B/HSP90-like ATPase [Hydrogenispora ethanolica]|jgi:signal transduction histidine kinase|uniref:histidine kinase n=1 Tax=Hydrogenispora ethanolica TaxID=1082276 RepID=A0A4V6NH04_HYDET|nr:PocR ligand-binding domain-containing protein [Hydrogenispora ethanolica]TCL70057.1 histidine kinase/DNA gyrase B/HSP90-like ATPase [Hydrogenispora ethanolica]
MKRESDAPGRLEGKAEPRRRKGHPGFGNLFDLRQIQKIQDTFSKATGVASIITDAAGKPLTRPSNFCRLCKLIRSTPEGLANCIHSDAVIGHSNPYGPNMSPCLSGGLWDGGASLYVDGKHVGNWLIGQVFTGSGEEERVLQYAKSLGVAQEKVRQALGEVTRMPEEQFRSICQFLFLNAQHLSRLATENLRKEREIERRRAAEAALRQARDELELKVDARTQELSCANEELVAMNEEVTAMNEELIHTNEQLLIEVEERQKAEQELTEAIEWLKAMQSHLIQSEKLAALGGLVAGVAHEINTPVGVGVTAASHLKQVTERFLDLCRNGAPRRRDLVEYLEDLDEASDIILKNFRRASGLIQSFKQVSVDQSSETRRVFQVRRYLGEILLSMNPRLKKTRHAITVECDDGLEIDGYPGAFAQIVTNLVMNSLNHAYGPDEAGRIRIAVSREAAGIQMVYSDDGRGIDEAVIGRIFDPFFTTRRGTGGTGLGLFVVYNIVTQRFGGTIQCASQPGRGATFHITLPF